MGWGMGCGERECTPKPSPTPRGRHTGAFPPNNPPPTTPNNDNNDEHAQARELKSVHVSTQAFMVRLVVHRCHVNKLNIYNQARWGLGF